MDWYYAQEGQQRGPVPEAELIELRQREVIDGNTLVWREGLENWRPFDQVVQAAALPPPQPTGLAEQALQATCCECGRSFLQGEMVPYAGRWVCTGCRPLLFRKIQEGVAVAGAFTYAGFWIRFAAKILDALLIWGATFALSFLTGLLVPLGPDMFALLFMLQLLVSIGVPAAYTTFFLGRFGATPGKMALGLRVVRPDGDRISYLRALGRHFAEWLSGLLCYVGYIIAAFDEEKRSLHDRICSTRVIRP